MTRNKAIFWWSYCIVQAAWLQLLACECLNAVQSLNKARSTISNWLSKGYQLVLMSFVLESDRDVPLDNEIVILVTTRPGEIAREHTDFTASIKSCALSLYRHQVVVPSSLLL